MKLPNMTPAERAAAATMVWDAENPEDLEESAVEVAYATPREVREIQLAVELPRVYGVLFNEDVQFFDTHAEAQEWLDTRIEAEDAEAEPEREGVAIL